MSAGFVDKAAARVRAQLGRAGFEEAMLAALAAEDVLAADETPVNVLDWTAPAAGEEGAAPEERDGKTAGGSPHVLITRTPDGRLAFFQAIASRRKSSVAAAVPPGFAGHLITDGYTGYQHLLFRLAGIQQCCQHVIRRCRAVTKLGPGGVQSWAGDIIAVLRDAPAAVEATRARGDTTLDQKAPMTCVNATTPPPPTAPPHLTPSRESPGYRHSPPSTDTNSRPPVNGHRKRSGCCTRLPTFTA